MPVVSKSDSDSTSASLLERVKGQDQQAWARLVAIYSPLIYHWCRQDARLQAADASDVLQEVFRSVSASIVQYEIGRRDASFRGWLRTITRNKIRDHFRREATQPMLHASPDELGPPQGLPDDSSDESLAYEVGVVARRALELMRADFEERTWRAFWLSAVEGCTAAEIAEQLGTTPQAVRQACYRVRRRLREELADML